ncbi:MAG: methionine synthase [Eggerthellaceae bacterium]|nr:methionine synthase [Eggerthellaceae bacterium]
MADLINRFHKDVLVVGDDIDRALERRGIDIARDKANIMLLEPETLEDAYRVEGAAQAPCIVANTADLLPARLLKSNMEQSPDDLAHAALFAASFAKPQHLLVEMGPCGLPLDPSSKSSVVENRDQYAAFTRAFEKQNRIARQGVYEGVVLDEDGMMRDEGMLPSGFDAYLLRGFCTIADMKCALSGMRMVSYEPIIAVIDVDDEGNMADKTTLEQAACAMADLEANVLGISVACGFDTAISLAKRLKATAETLGFTEEGLPVFVELNIKDKNYPTPDSMVEIGFALRDAGVQFIRAAGDATPAYTACLAAALYGAEVKR